jgi:TonB family protein
MWLMNLANYSAQLAAVVLAGSVAPVLLRIRRPDALLIYRQALLAACLLLPFLQPWRRPTADSSVAVTVGAGSIAPSTAPAPRHIPWDETAAILLGSGMLARLGWLAVGLARLHRYRRRAEVLIPLPPVFDALQRRLDVWPSVCLSGEVSSPVTFGVSVPVILLPPAFLTMPRAAQEAIACHELTHVRRRDWAAAMLEEVVRAVFWFHPAVWWLLGQIQLTREQTVDAQVIHITASREQYIDALLAVAGGHLQPDLAPAPLFLRKAHLTQRVALMLKEVSMSPKRLLSSLAAICGALVITSRFATLYFPISAPAQEIVRGGDHLLHRAPIEYPAEAIEKGIQGSVVVEATLDDRGVVTDARVISGPDPLRKAALKSVLDWHYAAQTQSPVEVAVDFKLPTAPARIDSAPKILSGTLKSIQFPGVSPSLREAVVSKLPVHVGSAIEADMNPYGPFITSLRQAIQEVDEHLSVNVRLTPHTNDDRYDFGLDIHYRTPVAQTAVTAEPIRDAQGGAPERIRVGGNVQALMVIYTTQPPYPPLAKQARIQGVVRLDAIIAKDGTMKDLRVASGHPLLVPAALEAVRQWVYKPTLLNGNPVEVATVVDVNFTLSQ